MRKYPVSIAILCLCADAAPYGRLAHAGRVVDVVHKAAFVLVMENWVCI